MASNNFLGAGNPMFTGENYHIWVIKMKAYLKALSLWEIIESEDDPLPLGPNPTVAQMKIYEDAKSRKPKALTCLHSTLSDVIFTRIMACETPKEVWEKLKKEFDGSDRVKTIKLLTLKREFEILRMKEGDIVKEYSAKLVEIVNKVRLFGETFLDSKVVEKMMISLPARFESKISAIEESCDLKTLSVAELISKLQAQEQRSSIRDEEVEEVAFQAQHKGRQPMKDNRRMEGDKGARENHGRNLQRKGSFHLAATVKEPIIKKKTVGSKESHRFSVDFVERWVILRKIAGPGRIIHNKTMCSRKNLLKSPKMKKKSCLWLLM
ncbi:uncharacterized protein [Solanum tuberosum]|uniref:uncharacterized protein n=1 Tax=Solanum tuberosum TaxID=4113 RepID=UPI00073A099C|nr:PREDICTED: uncharacterized protein LOC107061209 [Solanum tuberosum]